MPLNSQNEGTIITTIEKKDSYVIISIKDSGTGIDSEIFPRLLKIRNKV